VAVWHRRNSSSFNPALPLILLAGLQAGGAGLWLLLCFNAAVLARLTLASGGRAFGSLPLCWSCQRVLAQLAGCGRPSCWLLLGWSCVVAGGIDGPRWLLCGGGRDPWEFLRFGARRRAVDFFKKI
jgi:hypothetical protein